MFTPFSLVRNCRFEALSNPLAPDDNVPIDLDRFKIWKVHLFGVDLCYYFAVPEEVRLFVIEDLF